MMTIRDQSVDWERARRRAVQLRHFYVHGLAFVVGNSVAFFINWLTLSSGDNPWWFQWGLLVWGSALAVHAITLSAHGRFLGPRWEQHKIDEYLLDELSHSRSTRETG